MTEELSIQYKSGKRVFFYIGKMVSRVQFRTDILVISITVVKFARKGPGTVWIGTRNIVSRLWNLVISLATLHNLKILI